MPFTCSHPAAVIPLARRGLVLSALVVGSMAPDFEYYLRLSLGTDRYWHTIPGALGLALPAGFLALWAFHAWFKTPLVSLLPRPLQARLAPHAGPLRLCPARRSAAVLLSLAVGIASHLFCDLLTHANTWHGIALAGMRTVVFHALGTDILLCEALHLAGSVAGLAWLLWCGARWALTPAARRSRTGRKPVAPRRTLLAPLGAAAAMAASATAAAMAYGLHTVSPYESGPALRFFAGRVTVTAITVFSVQVALFCALWHARPAFRVWLNITLGNTGQKQEEE